MAMHIDEINEKEDVMCIDRNQCVGPVDTNSNLLAGRMQDLLLSSFCSKLCEFNACTKPVKNMNGKELCNFLMEAIKNQIIVGLI